MRIDNVYITKYGAVYTFEDGSSKKVEWDDVRYADEEKETRDCPGSQAHVKSFEARWNDDAQRLTDNEWSVFIVPYMEEIRDALIENYLSPEDMKEIAAEMRADKDRDELGRRMNK